jgi:hypothetical protein
VTAATTADGRGYELVDGPDPNLVEIPRMPAASDDGDRAAFLSFSGSDGGTSLFLANAQVAARTDSGWTQRDANIGVLKAAVAVQTNVPAAFSPDFTRQIVFGDAVSDLNDQNSSTDLYGFDIGSKGSHWLTHPDALPDQTTGKLAAYIGASTDLRRVTFYVTGGALLPGAPVNGIYVNDGEGTRLASILPDGTPSSDVTPVGYAYQRGYNDGIFLGMAVAHGGSHVVSDDGTRTFFYDRPASPGPLYERDGNRTLAVSASQRTGDVGTIHNATFLAASQDGATSLVWSDAQLTDSAPVGGGIYRFDLGSNTLTLLLAANDAAGMQISNAIASSDLSHLYFISPAMLDGAAQAGQSNAYVLAHGEVRYIATLNPGEIIGRVSREGRYAAFESAASLNGAPNNGHVAIYEYDASTGTLACASCRPDGAASQGDANLDDQTPGLLQQAITATRNLTDDGELFFATKDRIADADLGPAADIYAYDDGHTTLLSSGRSDSDAYLGDNSDDGRDVFFMTRDALVSEDVDGRLLDLYDARKGGGFPQPAAAGRDCTDDGCQGPTPPRPAYPSVRTSTYSGDGNVADKTDSMVSKTVRLSALNSAARAKLARTGKATLAIRVTGGGKVSAQIRGRLSGKTKLLASASRIVRSTKATTVHLPLSLSAAARHALKAHRRLKVTIEVRLAGVSRAQKSTMNLVAGKR